MRGENVQEDRLAGIEILVEIVLGAVVVGEGEVGRGATIGQLGVSA